MAFTLSGTKAHVKAAGNYFAPKHGITSVGGWRAVGSVPNSDHPKGLALDFMTRNKAQGDALAADVIANYKQWSVKYVIWWRREWSPGDGWDSYSGPSAHTDHVHVSFHATPGSGGTTTNPVANPLVPDALEDVAAFLNKIRDPKMWEATGYIIAGVVMLLIGILLISTGRSVTSTVKTVAKQAVKAK